MRRFRTENRLRKIVSAATKRQHSLRVVLENIHDPHNVSAIFRSCDAVGVAKVSLLYNYEKMPKLSKKSTASASAYKWVEQEKFHDVKECYQSLRNEGFKIYASLLARDAKDLYEIDFTQKIAIVLGNEHRGVSSEAADLADEIFYIPMHGMIQSLNVSVATAVTLYEAQRQRRNNKMYDESELSDKQLDALIDNWCER